MVVDHPHGLHERVADRRADEAEAAALQILAQCVRLAGGGGHPTKYAPPILLLFAADEPPHVRVEGPELALNPQERSSVGHRTFNLQTIPHETGILEKTLDSCGREPRHRLGIEVCEAASVTGPLLQDG